ncbi:MAG: 3-deoxy-manno-octulosonate cytidylyltransferase [Leadbetterella sp.]|nr:3-deoxy-manno-octulosonate cytidylyltransferase [Leadbetterella sp.]
MKILGIIPARYASSRLPAKLLLEVNGKSILQMVYERCLQAKSLSDVVIATDSPLVEDHVRGFGGNVVMTSDKHPSGTDRCAEALKVMGGTINYDFVINIQGDEPLMDPENINRLSASFKITSEISSVCIKISETDTLLNPNVVKVVINEQQEAMYFSRAPIPHLREVEIDRWVGQADYFKHIGMYGFRADILEKIVKLPLARLEAQEKLEQLRWLANGYKVKMVEVFSDGIGIDTEEDFLRLKQFLNK